MVEDDRIGDPFIRAGEYALGVLEGEELAQARRDLLSDRAFAEAVEWWQYRLGAMGEAAGDYLPSDAIWRAIEARVATAEGGNRNGAAATPRKDRFAGWSLATAVAGTAMAAAALFLVISRPLVPSPQAPGIAQEAGPQLIAQLTDEEAGRRLAGRVDTGNNRLAVKTEGLEAGPGLAPELWVIPAGATPVSLGSIPQSGEFSRSLSADETALLVDGATLAVTFEEDTGERHQSPTLPILLAGPLDEI